MSTHTALVRMVATVGLTLLLLSQSLSGQNPSGLRGTVTSVTHKPVANAYVLLHRTGAHDVHVRTDMEGKYEVALPVGIYDALISADDYIPVCRRVRIEPHEMMNFDAVLQIDFTKVRSD